MYIALAFIGFTEREAWKKTPYQINALFDVHKRFDPEHYKPEPVKARGMDPIDIALGGL